MSAPVDDGLDAETRARWRAAFASPPPGRPRPAGPPAPERVWEAAHGELDPAETAALAAAMAADPQLAEEWQLAVRARALLADPPSDARAPAAASAPARRRGRAAVALTSIAALAAAAALWLRRGPEPPAEVYRERPDAVAWGRSPAIVDRLGAPELRWLEIAGARRYRVRLMTPSFELVAEHETASPRLDLPADARLRPRFAWQVEALDERGGLLARSPTFRAEWSP